MAGNKYVVTKDIYILDTRDNIHNRFRVVPKNVADRMNPEFVLAYRQGEVIDSVDNPLLHDILVHNRVINVK